MSQGRPLHVCHRWVPPLSPATAGQEITLGRTRPIVQCGDGKCLFDVPGTAALYVEGAIEGVELQSVVIKRFCSRAYMSAKLPQRLIYCDP